MKKIIALLILTAVSFAWQNDSLDGRNLVTYNASASGSLANFPIFVCMGTAANFSAGAPDWASVNESDNTVLPFLLDGATSPSACAWNRMGLTPAGANGSFFIYHKNNTPVGTAQNATGTFSAYMGRWSMNDNVTGMNDSANSSSAAGFQKTRWTFASAVFAKGASTGTGSGSSKTFYTTPQLRLIGKPNTQYAISFWLKLGGCSCGCGNLLTARSISSNRYPFALAVYHNGTLVASTYDGTTQRVCNVGTGLAGTSDWKHMAITRNLTAFAVYVNGTRRCSYALAPGVDLSNSGNWCWGGDRTAPYCGNGENAYGNARFDEVRI
jgi:hypothetical protein